MLLKPLVTLPASGPSVRQSRATYCSKCQSIAEADSLSTSSPTPWSEAGWFLCPLHTQPSRRIVHSPAGTSQSSVPSADIFSVMSRTPSLRTVSPAAAANASGTVSRRTANVLQLRSVSDSRDSGCASLMVSLIGLFTTVARSAFSVTGEEKRWYLSETSPPPLRARMTSNVSISRKPTPSSDASTFSVTAPLQSQPKSKRKEMPLAVNGFSAAKANDCSPSVVFTSAYDTRSAGGVGNASTAMSA